MHFYDTETRSSSTHFSLHYCSSSPRPQRSLPKNLDFCLLSSSSPFFNAKIKQQLLKPNFQFLVIFTVNSDMGNQLGSNGSSTVTPRAHLPRTTLSMDQLRSYESARDDDPQLRQLDNELQLRANRDISALSIGADQPLPFSLDLLKEITGCNLEPNQQDLQLVLESKKDIWKNPDLFSLVEDYFQTSHHTLDFSALQRFLATAKLKQAMLRSALHRLAEAAQEKGECREAVEELRRFRLEETRFTEEVLRLFGTVYAEHLRFLERLEAQRAQLDKKFNRIKTWKKTASVIFAVIIVTVLVCSIVFAVITAPPVVAKIVTTLGAAASLAPTEIWFGMLWRKLESTVQEQREVVSSVQAGTLVAIKDLKNMKVLVKSLEAKLLSLVEEINESFGDGEEGEREVCSLAIEEIESKVGIFTRNVEELGDYVDCYSRNIQKARSVVFYRIMKLKQKK